MISQKLQVRKDPISIEDEKMIRLKGRLSPSSSPLRRLFKGDFSQRLSRFLFFRRAYSFLKNIQQTLKFSDYKDFLITGCTHVLSESTIDKVVKEVNESSVSFGLYLADPMVEEIFRFAACKPCMEPGYSKNFLMDELDQNNCLRDGHQVFRALVNDPNHCSAVNAIAQDSLLLQIASTYLRYYPTQITCHLTWSLASIFSESEVQKQYPASNFHYDIAGYNFATAYFYITPVLEESSGPHVMIKGSHKRKPLWMLLKSGRHSNESVYAYYGKEDEVLIRGKAGFGFFQDPSCIHKVKAPTSQNRLLLQIRYS